MEKKWTWFIGYFFLLFLIFPILFIGGISTAIFTETKDEFELVYAVIFLGALDIISLICLIGSIFRLRELISFNGNITIIPLFQKEKSTIPKNIVYFHLGGIILFCTFIIVSTGAKFISSILNLV